MRRLLFVSICFFVVLSAYANPPGAYSLVPKECGELSGSVQVTWPLDKKASTLKLSAGGLVDASPHIRVDPDVLGTKNPSIFWHGKKIPCGQDFAGNESCSFRTRHEAASLDGMKFSSPTDKKIIECAAMYLKAFAVETVRLRIPTEQNSH